MLRVETRKSDHRRKEHRFWQAWLDEAAVQATRFYLEEAGDDPFAYGETASVGFLGAMAARCNYLAIPEFAVTKKDALDQRKQKRGRADLWVRASDKRDWWFEFKQHFIARGSLRDLERKWLSARQCAINVRNNGVSVAGLIVTFSWLKRECPEKIAAAREVLETFCNDKQFAWCIKGKFDEDPETYFIFEIVDDT